MKLHVPQTRHRIAFTLVELLVVVAIIAILVALLLPGLSRAKSQANSARCQSNLRQLNLALLSYAHDFRDYDPPRQGVPYWTQPLFFHRVNCQLTEQCDGLLSPSSRRPADPVILHQPARPNPYVSKPLDRSS